MTFLFAPSLETAGLSYFAPVNADLPALASEGFHIADLAKAPPDVMIISSHGSDIRGTIQAVRGCFAKTRIGLWLWDNHLDQVNNALSISAADFYFPSHFYAAGRVASSRVPSRGHVPLCSAQWTLRDMLGELRRTDRSSRALVNYVNYPGIWRAEILRRIAAKVPEAHSLLLTARDRSRYFNKSRTERFAEWTAYKCTILLPVDRDLSTRLFDALLAGMVPIISPDIADLDAVIPPALQQRLGFVTLVDFKTETIRAAIRLAIHTFDAGGHDAAMERHRYVMENAMLIHRVRQMLQAV